MLKPTLFAERAFRGGELRSENPAGTQSFLILRFTETALRILTFSLLLVSLSVLLVIAILVGRFFGGIVGIIR